MIDPILNDKLNRFQVSIRGDLMFVVYALLGLGLLSLINIVLSAMTLFRMGAK